MNCSKWEERIALYAGGDLPTAEAPALERHVAECAGCQLLLSGLRESLRLLQAAHCEPVEEAHFAAVRARGFSEIERGRRPWWRQVWVYALVVATVVLVLVAVRPGKPKRMAVLTPAPVFTAAPPPNPVSSTAPTLAQVVPQSAAPRHHRPRPKATEETVTVKAGKPAEPLVVKLLTDDPSVVIYWITDSKGD